MEFNATSSPGNFKIGMLLEFLYIGCCRNNFSLDMEGIIDRIKYLENIISNMKRIMIQAK